MKRKNITIFTDGSCYWKVRLGGSGVYILDDENNEFFISKGYQNTTINRCELRAYILALQTLNENQHLCVTIYSDSNYVVKGVKTLQSFIDNNYQGCENSDLWRIVEKEHDRLRKRVRLRVIWTPGHGKDLNDPIIYGNTVADILADYKQFSIYEQDIDS